MLCCYDKTLCGFDTTLCGFDKTSCGFDSVLCDFDNTLCVSVRMLFGLTLLYVIHLVCYVALV